jgi:hypothetical protein
MAMNCIYGFVKATALRKIIRLATVVLAFQLLASQPAHALAVTKFGPLLFISFSYTTTKTAALDGNGLPIRDALGNPIFNETSKWDPSSPDPITQIGLHVTFDPTEVQVNTDPSTYGFLCEFSDSGICPTSPSDFPAPDPNPYGNAATPWSFHIDNVLGEAIFSADFSNNPVSINGNKDFFTFQTQWSDPKYLTQDTVVQHPESPNQFCRTASSTGVGDNRCGHPLPEPGTPWLLASGAFVAFIAHRRQTRRREARA